jgi:beta-N-acetylhexosaminidase
MLPHSLERLKSVELFPFSKAINAGVKMVMTAHLGIQALDGMNAPPATLSYRVITEMLRKEMGFTGVIVSDAFDMGAIRQGDFLGDEGIQAVKAGLDLLLLTSDPKDHVRIYDSLIKAYGQGLLLEELISASIARIFTLKNWITAHFQAPELHVIRSVEHLHVADEIAERSITLVQDRKHRLPLQLSPDKRIAVIVPEPQNLTPADTSSYVRPVLADEIKFFHPNMISLTTTISPEKHQRDEIIANLKQIDLIIAGTINANSSPNQAALIHQLMETNIPLIVIAMRLPYDLEDFPHVGTYLCTYSILQPSMKAVAKAIFGKIPFEGKLPVLVRTM